MGYHFSHSYKVPKTKKEKLQAAKQNFVAALIFGALTIVFAGWAYLYLKEQAESSKAQAESSKKNEDLFRDLARSQGAKPQPKPSPANEPPATQSNGSVNAAAYITTAVAGVVSLLSFCMGVLNTVKARQMPEERETDRAFG